MSIPALHDRLLPCRTPSARRRHIAKTEQCAACGIDGAIPEHMWRRQPAAVAVRAPQGVAT